MTKPWADIEADRGLRARLHRWWYRRVTWPRRQREFGGAVAVIEKWGYVVRGDERQLETEAFDEGVSFGRNSERLRIMNELFGEDVTNQPNNSRSGI